MLNTGDNMKHVLSVDVQQKDEVFQFMLSVEKKRSTFEVRSLNEGFKKVMELIEVKNG